MAQEQWLCDHERAAEGSYPMSKEQPGGANLLPRSGVEAALCWGSHEERPHVQGKRNPSKTVGVARGHHRADRLIITNP